MPNLVSYLASILGHTLGHKDSLADIRKGQLQIMATLADVQAKLDAVNAVVAGLPVPISQIADAVANVASDIQTLKDQIGQEPAGITPEEADGVVVGLQGTLDALQVARSGLEQVAASLQTVADAQ